MKQQSLDDSTSVKKFIEYFKIYCSEKKIPLKMLLFIGNALGLLRTLMEM